MPGPDTGGLEGEGAGEISWWGGADWLGLGLGKKVGIVRGQELSCEQASKHFRGKP